MKLGKEALHAAGHEQEDIEVPEEVYMEIANGEGSFWSKLKHAAKAGVKFGMAHRQEIMKLGKAALHAAGHEEEDIEVPEEALMEIANGEGGWFSKIVHAAKAGAKFGLAHRAEIMHLGKEALHAAGHEEEVPEFANEDLAEIAAGEGSFWSKLKHAAKAGVKFGMAHRQEIMKLGKAALHAAGHEEIPEISEEALMEIANGEGSFWGKLKHAASAGVKFGLAHRQEIMKLGKAALHAAGHEQQ